MLRHSHGRSRDAEFGYGVVVVDVARKNPMNATITKAELRVAHLKLPAVGAQRHACVVAAA
jgi:hypothetical protein